MSRPGFLLNCRQKEKFVGRAVHSALDQTVPCEILISDQHSTDHTLREIWKAVNDHGPTHHNVKVLRCPVDGVYGMRSSNLHFQWLWKQLPKEVDVIFQLSADDYSLPDRVKVCMEGVEGKPFSCVACTMFFEEPGNEKRQSISGYPKETGYVDAGAGLLNLAYGSVIMGFTREFLEKMDDGLSNTPDVYFGFLSTLDKGMYVVCNPQHVHMQHASTDNMGFQGKLRGATGNELMQVAELNHFQLLALYDSCYTKAQELYPQNFNPDAQNACLNMMLGQAKGWLAQRQNLHKHGVVPGIMPV